MATQEAELSEFAQQVGVDVGDLKKNKLGLVVIPAGATKPPDGTPPGLVIRLKQ